MIVVLLPAYNEEEGLPPLLATLADVARECGDDLRVIVVNDGSRDRTREAALGFTDRLRLHVVDHAENRGLAEAMRTGLREALKSLAPPRATATLDAIVTMDADNTHSPWLIPRMLIQLREGSDIVIASRYRPGAHVRGVTRTRRLLSWGGGWIFRLLLPIPGARDYTCGYRAFRAELLQRAVARYGDAFITEPGFSCMVDILLKLNVFAPIVTEVPLVLRYDRKRGPSKMRVGDTALRSLRLALRRRFGTDRLA